jgi:hypothetical protein
VPGHTAGHDERLRLGAALGEAPLDEQHVQALAHGRRLACCGPRFKARKEQVSHRTQGRIPPCSPQPLRVRSAALVVV